jgi:DNA invertase Pin-like site-specific DNA recombinase
MAEQLRAAIYCRVSDPGAADKFGMDAQRAECLAYAERHGWAVVAIYEDYQTGTELFERAEMTRCREAMRRRAFDFLIVDRLDRLSRKAHHQGFIRTEAERYGVTVVSATEDLSNPILVGVKAGIAEANRDEIVRNMARGRRMKAAKGLPLGQGKPPYGLTWRIMATHLPDGSIAVRKVGYDIDPATVGHLRRIFRDYAQGASLRSLAITLEADGVLPPYHDRTGSTAWSVGTLREILTNRVYIGEAEAFRTTSTREPNPDGIKTRRHRRRPADDRVRLPDGTAPVVIDPALFARVQERLERNRRESCRRDRNPQVGILRRGFGVCGVCGHPLSVVKTSRGATIYRCHTDAKRLWGCPGCGTIDAAKLDEAIWSWLTAELADEARVRWHLEQQLAGDDPEAADLATIDRQLEQIARQQANLAQAIAMLGENPDAVAPLLAQLETLGKQKRAAETERAAIVARQRDREAAREHIRDIQERCRQIAGQMARVTSFADRRAMLEVLGVRLTLYPRDHRPRWVARSIISPAGITSENMIGTFQNTEHLAGLILRFSSDDLTRAA